MKDYIELCNAVTYLFVFQSVKKYIAPLFELLSYFESKWVVLLYLRMEIRTFKSNSYGICFLVDMII